MSEEFMFDDNDDIFSNVEFPEEENMARSNLADSRTQKCTNNTLDLDTHSKLPIQKTSIFEGPKDEVLNKGIQQKHLRKNAALHITTELQLSPVLSINERNNIQEERCNSKRETSKKLVRKSSSYLDDCSPVKRLFPGPAGIFLDSGQNESNDNLCTQGTFSVFQDGGLWEKMCRDLCLGNGTSLSEKFNIEWIKKEASSQNNLFLNHKAPFLAGVIQSLEVVGVQQKTVNVTLRDVTGVIQGMIEHSLYTDYASNFTLGSVIVVTNFTVLCCTCNKCDNFHLTITKNNLCSIYGRKKLELQKLDPQKILTDYYKKLDDLRNKNSDILSKTAKNSSLQKNVCKQAAKNNQNQIVLTHSNQIRTDENSIIGATLKCGQNKVTKNLDKAFGCGQSPELSNIKRYTFKSIKNTEIVPLVDEPTSNKTRTKENETKLELKDVTSHGNRCENVVNLGNSAISVTVKEAEEKEIWEETLKGLDMNQFLEDF